MGLFDRFRKVAEVTDTESLSAEAESAEAQQALQNAQQPIQPTQPESVEEVITHQEDDWDDLDQEVVNEAADEDDEWDDFDDEEEIALPVELTKAQRKLLEREKKVNDKAEKARLKEIKKRSGDEQSRPQGSSVTSTMIQNTTVRKQIRV